jgi:hypothetical protein
MRLAIVAQRAGAGVAGLEGDFAWGEARTLAPNGEPPEADILVAIGAAATGREPDLRLAADERRGEPAAPPAARVVATCGPDLWSRAPWPVRDDLFDLEPAPAGAGLLVVTDGGERDASLLDKLSGRGIPFTTASELTAEALAAAAAVAFPPSPDGEGRYAPGARQEALPATVLAPLAAGRFLIAPRAEVTFGLLPGIDHLAAGTDDDVLQYADTLHAFPEAFAPQVAFGRIAAERARASAVYGRLAEQIVAERRRDEAR